LDIHRVAKPSGLWQTVGMTDQPTNQQQRPQHREDCKVQKLVERIEMKLALQAKAIREASQASSKN
jgi:cytochrome c-type biogenesis protein CcmH/NrfG